MAHVFISYVRDDQETIDRLASALRGRSIEVWLDREQILPGHSWQDAIRVAIKRGSFFIACFSRAYASRTQSYMNEELNLAIEEIRQRRADRAWFIPLLLDDCSIPDQAIGGGRTLRTLQWIDLGASWDSGIDKLVAALTSAPPPAVDRVDVEPQHQRTIEISGSPKAVLEVHSLLSRRLKPQPRYIGSWDKGDEELRDLTVLDEAAVKQARKLLDDWNRSNPDSTVLFLDLSADIDQPD